ncbi:MAG TPA: c-type cytochrome [Gemmatimonadales bacterium]|nr:c-type cytochrome [Gemmatimonadales bacterium]
MNKSLFLFAVFGVPGLLSAQAQGKFPPDSLINVKVIPKNTPVMQVVGMMRNFAGALGVRCPFCHVGQEGQPLASFDFAKDEKRTKLTARQMMRMVEEINRRIDTLPHDHDHDQANQPPSHDTLHVTCNTCHRGVNRPVPLEQLIAETAQASGADSASRAYRALRERYYGRAAYDFGEPTLDIAAFRVARAGKYDDAFAILKLNEEQFPNSSNAATFRGNINLMKGDTTAAIAAFREAVKRDSTNGEAQNRLRQLTATRR